MEQKDAREFSLIREKVEVLTGERADGAKRAIRVSDLAAARLIKIPPAGASQADQITYLLNVIKTLLNP